MRKTNRFLAFAATGAAALAAKSGTTPYRLDLGAVRAALRAQGAIVP